MSAKADFTPADLDLWLRRGHHTEIVLEQNKTPQTHRTGRGGLLRSIIGRILRRPPEPVSAFYGASATMSTGMVHTVRQTVWNSLETWTKVVHVRREHR